MFTTNEYLRNRPLVTATMFLFGGMLMSQVSAPNPDTILVLADSLAGCGAVLSGGEFFRQHTGIRWLFLAEAIVGSLLVISCAWSILH